MLIVTGKYQFRRHVAHTEERKTMLIIIGLSIGVTWLVLFRMHNIRKQDRYFESHWHIKYL